jgi:Cof subfamily protein (haloacid dehalogenase superfamily)
VKRLIALDLDGTVLQHDSSFDPLIARHLRTLESAGHEIVIATGRSVDATLPVVEQLKIRPRWVVACNGAVVLARDAMGDRGYRTEYAETFDTTEVLTRIRTHLFTARYAVEDAEGSFLYTEAIPDATLPTRKRQVAFDELLGIQATRVIVVSPDQQLEEFLRVVEEIGLTSVSYAIGWTAWLDIAPDGVSKASALELIAARLEIPRHRVLAAGDGRNDLQMLEWAARHGVAIAMGQAPPEVHQSANRITGTVEEGGLATALELEFPELLSPR